MVARMPRTSLAMGRGGVHMSVVALVQRGLGTGGEPVWEGTYTLSHVVCS